MPLHDSTCDSCGEATDVLFPVAILDELPTGGMGMVKKYYCYSCYEDICEEAESNSKEEDEKEEEDNEEPYRTNSGKCSAYDALPKMSWPKKSYVNKERRPFNIENYCGVNW